MIKKMKFALAPILLSLTLGACSDKEETAPKEEAAPEAAEQKEAASAEQPASKLELPANDEVAVVVNGEDVKGNIYSSVARQLETSIAAEGQDTSDAKAAEQVKSQAISVIVGNKLIIQDAEKKGHKADETALKERMEEMKGQFENEEAMNKTLKSTGYSMEDLENQLREQLVYESYVAEEIESGKVTDEEVQKAYDGYVETSEQKAPAFKEMEPTIRQSLEQQKIQDAVFERIEELKKDAKIDVKI
ncbi:SurA N-terminal domain-containing protein [Planococcus sp. N028]|uniref:SurA N-terminal domain-containing protein n=1 Tax=Planococcus shixiaomingii TaxID=3058393 RepID=A0ABT8N633_9BACL|nr:MULTISPECIES: SurA N-terminal domain-containing protein [unclassified Planococcus (in: firmicutes)]MDN7243112.1 SurA N-terminal domain-containing protein [Planococcus sp. N028]WKA55057.1 SurA N-terminal domain-containing protein [Planococcus sp. N022]